MIWISSLGIVRCVLHAWAHSWNFPARPEPPLSQVLKVQHVANARQFHHAEDKFLQSLALGPDHADYLTGQHQSFRRKASPIGRIYR